jgi:hypothetical protein
LIILALLIRGTLSVKTYTYPVLGSTPYRRLFVLLPISFGYKHEPEANKNCVKEKNITVEIFLNVSIIWI